MTDKHGKNVNKEARQSTSTHPQNTPHSTIQITSVEADCKIDTIVLGDSNMKDIDNPSSVLVIAESGASFISVNKLAELAKKSDLIHVTSVIMQLGTNDVTKHNGDRLELMVNAPNAIQIIEELFPNATVGVCSIPPRRGKENAVSNNNNAANKTNMFMKKYCAKNIKIVRGYLDNTFVQRGTTYQEAIFSNTPKWGPLNMILAVYVIPCILSYDFNKLTILYIHVHISLSFL